MSYSIESLTPDAVHYFRVRMINSYGESQVSPKVVECTNPVIPGPPQTVRISRKRTENTLKLRWKPPAKKPKAVDKYIAQICKVKSKKHIGWKDYATVDSNTFFAMATELKPDTLYCFRVCGVTRKGGAGEFSEEVEVETRCRRASHVPGTMDASILGLGTALLFSDSIEDSTGDEGD